MEKIVKILKNLGLAEKEITIYLSLLELGSATVQEIAKKSEIKRTNIYNFLGSMKQTGLISELRHGKKTLIIPENPQALRQRAQENLVEIDKAIPQLMGIFNIPGNKPNVKYYEGKEGVKQAFEAILIQAKSTIYAVVDPDQMMKTMDEEYMWNWASRRGEKDIWYHAIAKTGPKGDKAAKLNKKHKRRMKFVKNVKFSTEILIFDNMVAMISYKKPYGATIIEDIAIADTMKAMWKGWWNSLK